MVTIWTTTAEKSYYELIIYFSEYWGKRQFENFKFQTLDLIKKIEKNPAPFPKYNEEVRKCILLEKIALYYRHKEENNRIEILLFRHNSL